ncbi:response regulator [Rhodococcus opacus]|nr:response regulator [Rhodococcus opacus]
MNVPADHPPVPGTALVAAPDVEPQFAAPLRAAGLRVQTGHVVPIRATAESPDVVVLDARSPDVDGLRIVRALRAAESVRGILVLGQFSRRDDNHTCAYFEAGADDVLGAPRVCRRRSRGCVPFSAASGRPRLPRRRPRWGRSR